MECKCLGKSSKRKRRIITSADQSKLAGIWNINGKFSYRISDALKAYIHINNNLNKHHLTPAQGTLNGGVASRGMEATIGVNWLFVGIKKDR